MDKNSPGRLCENGPTKVTGTSWLGKKETVECVKAGDAVEFLFNNCGEKGGECMTTLYISLRDVLMLIFF